MAHQPIVLDANVLFPRILRFLFAEIWQQSALEAIQMNTSVISFRISNVIIEEVIRNIQKKSPNMTDDKLQRLTSDLRIIYGTDSVITDLNITQHLDTTRFRLRDPNDEHVLALARQVQAEMIISSDPDLLTPSQEIRTNFGIAVLHPYQFLGYLAQNQNKVLQNAIRIQNILVNKFSSVAINYRQKLFDNLGGQASVKKFGDLPGISGF